jgi:hypothetical protein
MKEDGMSFLIMRSLAEKTDDRHNDKVCNINGADPRKETAPLLSGRFSVEEGNQKKEAYGETHEDDGNCLAVEPQCLAGARRSAFFPISGGRSVVSVTTMPRVTSHIMRSL